jgi:hypothetical protein
VCACTYNFVCARCAGTPFDPRYEEDAHEPMSPQEFDALADTYRIDDDWPTRFWV